VILASMQVRAAALLVVLSGCGGAPLLEEDAAVVDASVAEACVALQERYREIVLGLDDTCTTPGDCELVGAVDTCDCAPYLGPSCWGHPVNGGALDQVRDQLAPIYTEFRERCRYLDSFELEAVCDCEPWATATCVGGRCGRDVGEWCLGPIEDPDAGP
jgi:hypothetical protein